MVKSSFQTSKSSKLIFGALIVLAIINYSLMTVEAEPVVEELEAEIGTEVEAQGMITVAEEGDEETVTTELTLDGSVEYFDDILTRQREYIELRQSGLEDEGLKNISENVIEEMEVDLSDLSTQITEVEKLFVNIGEDNYVERFEEIQNEMLIVNTELVELNESHLSKIMNDINERYIDPHEDLMIKISSIVEENEDFVVDYDEVVAELEVAEELISELNKEFSDANWVRLEENLKQLLKSIKDSKQTSDE